MYCLLMFGRHKMFRIFVRCAVIVLEKFKSTKFHKIRYFVCERSCNHMPFIGCHFFMQSLLASAGSTRKNLPFVVYPNSGEDWSTSQGWVISNGLYYTFTLSWSFIKNSGIDLRHARIECAIGLRKVRKVMPFPMYGVFCLTTFSYVHDLEF